MLSNIIETLTGRPVAAGGLILAAITLVYVFYQRYLHPLARYPGPFLASITDLWQAYQFFTLKQPYYLTELHEKYGLVVRYAPDKLSITYESAIPIIYQKSSKAMPKTEFYDAYGSAHPNVFGMRDEEASLIKQCSTHLTLLVTFYKTTTHVAQLLSELYQRDGKVHGLEHPDAERSDSETLHSR